MRIAAHSRLGTLGARAVLPIQARQLEGRLLLASSVARGSLPTLLLGSHPCQAERPCCSCLLAHLMRRSQPAETSATSPPSVSLPRRAAGLRFNWFEGRACGFFSDYVQLRQKSSSQGPAQQQRQAPHALGRGAGWLCLFRAPVLRLCDLCVILQGCAT